MKAPRKVIRLLGDGIVIVLNPVGLRRLRAGYDLCVRIPAHQSQHITGLRQNKREEKIANVGIETEIRRQVMKDEYRAKNNGNGHQY